MTAAPQNLSTLQRWMQAVIQHPGGVGVGVNDALAQGAISVGADRLPEVIVPSTKQTSAQRLQIYADAYFARLLEVLANEFPALKQSVGDELFAGFALGYLHAHPSTTYTLGNLGARFPEYLAATRPPRENAVPDWSDFLIDCCRLERLYAEVFDGPGPERTTLSLAHAVASFTAETFTSARLQLAPWVHLIALQFPVHEFITAVRRGESPRFPDEAATWLVVSRRDYRVRRVPVSAAEFALLTEVRQGATIGDALTMLAGSPFATAVTPADIGRWFHNWTAAGYFQSADGTATRAAPE